MEDSGAAEAENSEGHTPLIWALASGRTAVARDFLGYNKKNKKTEKKRKNASLSARDGATGAATAEAAALFWYALLSQKLDLVIDAFPGILEQGESLLSVAEWGTSEQLRYIVSSQKVPVNYQNTLGSTALHNAIYSGEHEKVRMLLEQRGLDINTARHDNGETPLHAACAQNLNLAKLLLTCHDVDLLSVNSHGSTPLMTTISACQHEIFELLLERLATTNIWQKDLDGETALSLAAYNEDEKLVRRLLDPALGISKEIVSETIHSIDIYLFGPKRLPKKTRWLFEIRERQDRIRKGTYRILVEYREQIDG
ncbi:ankyrin repeat-containing domain protein [Aspergillus granulosus]|uniref:Ankyrin repeat-containing domain protein n=1 Tax=Aspergillus granulosus TaxID=176169 RepID=A0ABR4HYI3_9EURO